MLTAPPPVAPVAPTQAETLARRRSQGRRRSLDSMVDRYLEGVTSLDVHGPDFAKRVDEHPHDGRRGRPRVGRRLERAARQAAGVDDAGRPDGDVDRRPVAARPPPHRRGPRPGEAGRPVQPQEAARA